MLYTLYMETKGDWDFRIPVLVKSLMELIFNPVVNFGEVRRAELAKSTLFTSTLVPLGSFQILKICSDAKENGVWKAT